MPRSAALVVLATLVSIPAAAQSQARTEEVPERAPEERAGRFFLSGGTDALGRDFGDAAPGIAAHAGYERRVGRSRSLFSIRLAGDYWRTGRTFTGNLNDGQGPLDVHRTTTLVGGSLLGVVRLPSVGAVRPYALAGIGMQQYANRNETEWVPHSNTTGTKVVYLPPVRVNTVSYTGGIGASGRLGALTPFVEARLMVLPGLGGVGGQQVRAPLTFGFRF